MSDTAKNCSDWAGDWRSLTAVWGLPCAAMLAATFHDPLARTVIWTLALVWMGVACLANARRCARTHCRFTGPFFLVMAALVVAYSVGALPLGAYGWMILGVVTAIGNAILWWASERILGRFQTLIITSGLGWVQREGGPIEEIRTGDVVWFPPGLKHWHGATPTTAMTHIAIQESLDGKNVDWMEKVSDEQYRT